MKKIVLLFSMMVFVLSIQAQKVNSGDANVLMSGIGGTDKFVSTGAEITFNKEVAAFKVVGSTSIIVTSIKEGRKGDAGIESASGKYNYKDEAIILEPGEIYVFSEYVIKMTFTSGGKILVNYRK